MRAPELNLMAKQHSLEALLDDLLPVKAMDGEMNVEI
jgi:hypothetical protein